MTAPVVETTLGPVRGVAREHDSAFFGIRYAKAPVGELRFMPPEPLEAWQEPADATKFGPTPQRWLDPEAVIVERKVGGSEILNLNVFTPDTAGSAPVLVYIHGGAYVGGAPMSPWFDGAPFTRDGIMLVTPTYRLGYNGFAHIDGAPDNRGVLDWIAALEWVQANIAAFGGDPARVTIAGQSAGGGAVLMLLSLERAQHLFAQAIAFSPAMNENTAAAAIENGKLLAERAGITPDLEGFRSKTEDELLYQQGQIAVKDSALRPIRSGLRWEPFVDGVTLPRPPIAAIASGAGHDKPLLIGATRDEIPVPEIRGSGLVPGALAVRYASGSGRVTRAWRKANKSLRRGAGSIAHYATARVFHSLIVRTAAARERADAATWVYEFTEPGARFGSAAAHCTDLPYWFDCLGAEGVAKQLGEHPSQALADEMHGAIVRFVSSGDPGWPAFERDGDVSGEVRIFGGSGPALQRGVYDGARAATPQWFAAK